MEHLEELASPMWEALNGQHSHLAIGTDNAKHYPLDLFIGAGLKHNSDDDLRELASLVEPGQIFFIIGKSEHQTEEWITIGAGNAVQMCCPERIPIPEHDVDVVTLDVDDVPDMLALIAVTEPGPFEKRTIELRHYKGIRDNGQLVAMAGSRMSTAHFREISAVCTHPDYRGRGYAGLLTSILVNDYLDEDITPFLHAHPENSGAIHLYEKLGFVHNSRPPAMLIQRAEK